MQTNLNKSKCLKLSFQNSNLYEKRIISLKTKKSSQQRGKCKTIVKTKFEKKQNDVDLKEGAGKSNFQFYILVK